MRQNAHTSEMAIYPYRRRTKYRTATQRQPDPEGDQETWSPWCLYYQTTIEDDEGESNQSLKICKCRCDTDAWQYEIGFVVSRVFRT